MVYGNFEFKNVWVGLEAGEEGFNKYVRVSIIKLIYLQNL